MIKNWALAIGINQYDFLQPLKYAKRDAQLMQNLLCNEAGFDRVFLFSDDSPDIGGESTRPYRANLRRCLRQIAENSFIEPEDNFWFFFSGHGIRHGDDDYLMPADGDPDDVENTAISIQYLTECLRRCGSDNVVLILDACHYQQKRSGEGIGRQIQQLARQTGVISILSCSPHEASAEIDVLQTGAFTHALLEGLGIQGQCATVKRLQQYLCFRVPEIVAHYKYPRQTPDITQPVTKSHLILIPKYATLEDIAKQQINTVPAEVKQNLELAEALKLGVKVAAVHTVMQTEKVLSELWVGSGDNLNHKTLFSLNAIASPHISETAIDYLSSERGVDYTHLRDLLASGNWREADRETLKLMLKVAARTQAGWLNIESINNFPEIDLCTIDQLWVKYSHGRFGFSVQKRIWESVGGDFDADYETWCQFGDRIGWRRHDNWLFYSDLNFSSTAPVGHFPAAGSVNLLTVWQGWAVGLFSCLVGFSALASRLGKSSL
ncbi:GUN4 domain-containing protein [Calothrix sp. PCC 7507]|uniref:GUN4 domain-containing protein n=1 Tax=Calothrix sp. PCC 7507 TaxID=99598 RepID=UPI0002FDC154|nr:GUN4 domain-containing protein [Calothrix sp. PCC 7507]